MEQKTKFILFGAFGLSVIFFFLFLSASSSKQKAMRERDELEKEKTVLTSEVDKLKKGLRDYENRMSSLKEELDRASREKQEVEKKYELAKRERMDLLERLKTRPEQASTTSVVQQQAIETGSESQDSYWAGILKAKTDLELRLNDLAGELRKAQIDLEQISREKGVSDLALNNLKRERDDFRRQMEYNQKLSDTMSRELVSERNYKMRLQDSFMAMKNENTILTRQLSSLSKRKSSLENKLQKLQDERDSLERKYSEMETMLSAQVTQVNKFKQEMNAMRSDSAEGQNTGRPAVQSKGSVQLPAIIVRPQEETQSRFAGLEGRVLKVKKESNFVIVDLGLDAGLKAGDILEVVRGSRTIAVIEVIQARSSVSACDIKNEKELIRIGDLVR